MVIAIFTRMTKVTKQFKKTLVEKQHSRDNKNVIINDSWRDNVKGRVR